MVFEERLILLKNRVQAEYDCFMQTATFSNGGILEIAKKIVVMEEALNLIKGNAFEHPYDVELLLSSEMPLADFVGQLDLRDWEITSAVCNELDNYIFNKMTQLSVMRGDYDMLSESDKEKIEQFTENVKPVIDYRLKEYQQEQDDELER